MAVAKTFFDPDLSGLLGGGIILTHVVPAPSGCNMNCSFCAIAARKEQAQVSLVSQDYLAFTKAVIERFTVNYLLLQGYEPLLPESWELSSALLMLGNTARVPRRGVVTNGWYLANRAEELVAGGNRIAVSLDSPVPAEHDRLRQTPGAFDKAVKGIWRAVELEATHLEVASVLLPKRDDLIQMPKFLRELGVRRWVVTPLIRFSETKDASFAESDTRILDRIGQLASEARRYDVELIFDDELNVFDRHPIPRGSLMEYSVMRFAREGLIRMTPNGRVAVGSPVMRDPLDSVPHWDPSREDAIMFVERVVAPALLRESALAA